ncbi:GNAT family N-acetyltransferase [Caulobacter sp. BE254]|uniref:GNAT family N-acetyltransferase n=1 Tax=Caulobacter sp. BE254 TaxID=2817720 RepID=UPI00285C1F2C|nr:GNAT family N-acetyltransferase [Caulobacter sp. BE254]MDR7115958.1 RimJ/RimL family protein N-acetyltransferase [Caulobacter sp. BE254]
MDRLVTARLIAERLDQRDLPDLVALHLDPDVSRYLGGIRSAEATGAYLAANLAHWDRHGFGPWIWRKPDGAFVGRAGIRPLTVERVPEIEIAYALARGAWGQGYAGEITERLVEHALERLALPSLVGVVMIDHGASRRVLERARFAFEREVVHAGEPCALYRLNRPMGDATAA